MLDPIFRQVKDRSLTPLALRLGPSVSPNLLTAASLGFGVLAALFAYQGRYGWALGAWALNRLIDGLDGVAARLHRTQTDLGGYLDLLADFVVYALIPVGLVLGRPESPLLYLATIALLASFYVNAASWMILSAILEKRARGAGERREQTTVSMPVGVVGGTETLVFYTLFLLIPQRLTLWFWVMTVLVSLGVVQRLAWAVRNL